jgi:hypothetical protein
MATYSTAYSGFQTSHTTAYDAGSSRAEGATTWRHAVPDDHVQTTWQDLNLIRVTQGWGANSEPGLKDVNAQLELCGAISLPLIPGDRDILPAQLYHVYRAHPAYRARRRH